MLRLRELIQRAEAGDYDTDYALRSCLVEYGIHRPLPEELVHYLQRALFRDVGQSIEQALTVPKTAVHLLEILKRQGREADGQTL